MDSISFNDWLNWYRHEQRFSLFLTLSKSTFYRISSKMATTQTHTYNSNNNDVVAEKKHPPKSIYGWNVVKMAVCVPVCVCVSSRWKWRFFLDSRYAIVCMRVCIHAIRGACASVCVWLVSPYDFRISDFVFLYVSQVMWMLCVREWWEWLTDLNFLLSITSSSSNIPNVFLLLYR